MSDGDKWFSSVQFSSDHQGISWWSSGQDSAFTAEGASSVAQPCPTLCDPMNCSTPGLPVHHQLPEFTQTHVH